MEIKDNAIETDGETLQTVSVAFRLISMWLNPAGRANGAPPGGLPRRLSDCLCKQAEGEQVTWQRKKQQKQ